MKISIVTSLFNSEDFITEFYKSTIKAIEDCSFSEYEIIFVNDGSPDNSLEKVLQLRKSDSNIRIYDLSRNFGHHSAIYCGLQQATGDYIYMLDSDLEELPEWLVLFYNNLISNKDLDVVYGIQKEREGTLYRRWAGALYYKILNFISDIYIPPNTCNARVITRKYLDAMLLFEDSTISLDGLFAVVGFKQKGMPVKKPYKGTSGYSLSAKLNLAINTVITSTVKPLYWLSLLGVIIAFPAFVTILWLVIDRLFIAPEEVTMGWASLFASIWMFGGLILSSLGMLGLYMAKVYVESKDNPLYVIRDKWE